MWLVLNVVLNFTNILKSFSSYCEDGFVSYNGYWIHSDLLWPVDMWVFFCEIYWGFDGKLAWFLTLKFKGEDGVFLVQWKWENHYTVGDFCKNKLSLIFILIQRCPTSGLEIIFSGPISNQNSKNIVILAVFHGGSNH
jgi:hypothetical protein